MEQQNRQKKVNNPNNNSHQNNNNNNNNSSNNNNNNSNKSMNELLKQQTAFSPGVISRERSFVKNSNQQNNNNNKRRSLAFNINQAASQQSRNKPAMDIYRPPKLNNKLQHSSSSNVVFPSQPNSHHMLSRRQAGLSLGSAMPLTQTMALGKTGQRPILAATQSHPMPYSPIGSGISQHVPLINSPSSGNILTQAAGINRVKFAAEPEKRRTVNFNNYNHKNNQYSLVQQQQQHPQQQQQLLQHRTQYSNNQGYIANGIDPYNNYLISNPLQRSKSLSSADTLTRSIAGLGLGLTDQISDIGQFTPEIQLLIDDALDDPNKLNSRCLMELSTHFIMRAVEGRRYALPIARCCLSIIAKEHKETFLEALLNTCRQRYQEREKWLFAIQGMKSPSRARFTAFMAFLTEMFCQLKRRQLQLRTQCEGVSPPLVLLTLLEKCCEDCVKPPVRSLSEIDCLFYVLTCVGQDLEQQLPQQLQGLLSLIRDAFLNAGDSAPVIRRTLLQLIELQASHWQLPGNTVLYYYPAAK